MARWDEPVELTPRLEKSVRASLQLVDDEPLTRRMVRKVRSLSIEGFTDEDALALERIERLRALLLTKSSLSRFDVIGRHPTLESFEEPQGGIRDADLEHFRHFHSLALQRTAIGDEGIARLQGAPELRCLQLFETRITDRSLAICASIPNLTWLTASATDITDEGVKHLAALPLQVLAIDGTPITDAALEVIGQITTLEMLYIGGSQVTDQGLEQLMGLTKLWHLGVYETKITKAAALAFKKAKPRRMVGHAELVRRPRR